MTHSIFLSPQGRDKETRPKIIFHSKEIKENYITSEGRFCMKEYDSYLTSNPSSRKKAQKDLDRKRIIFARQQDYAPKKGDKFTWVKQSSDGGDEPKRYA